jgi:Tol biopolymer transport system component
LARLVASLAGVGVIVGLTAGAGSEEISLAAPGERRLRSIRQLTFGGENAEAYYSFDGKKLVFQSTRGGYPADQIYVMNTDGTGLRRVSNGKGRCTCAYFLKGNERVLFSSTHLVGEDPPPPPDRSQGYVWAVYPSYDIFTARLDGSDPSRITDEPGYDAEATVSPDGRRVVFTSTRDGDLDLYTMDPDGRNVRRLTRTVGYDGGAFFSPDSRMICFRAHRPRSGEETAEYQRLLKQGLIRPSKLELFVMNADGTGERQVTKNGAANFCPFFTPDGKRLIFSSNMDDPQGREFDLYLVNLDGTGLERVTTAPQFDGFPMFSPDGEHLVWASNRNAKERGETNLFLADWVP